MQHIDCEISNNFSPENILNSSGTDRTPVHRVTHNAGGSVKRLSESQWLTVFSLHAVVYKYFTNTFHAYRICVGKIQQYISNQTKSAP